MPPFPGPIAKSGRVILLATVKAKSGQADKIEELLKECRRAAYQDEKHTHTYRTTRGEGDKSDTFVIFEEYDLSEDGLEAHVNNKPFKDLAGADLIADLDIKYFHEFE